MNIAKLLLNQAAETMALGFFCFEFCCVLIDKSETSKIQCRIGTIKEYTHGLYASPPTQLIPRRCKLCWLQMVAKTLVAANGCENDLVANTLVGVWFARVPSPSRAPKKNSNPR